MKMTTKTLLFLFLLFNIAFTVVSQDEILPLDGNGRYEFMEVVDARDFDSLLLLNNAEAFLKDYINKNQKKTLHRDDDEGNVTARSSFLVYKKGSLGKHVDGAIEYSLKIEVKDQRYRYTLSEFYFQEYQRDRYGKFQPVSGKVKPLESAVSKLNEWQWEEHKETVDEKMMELISALKVDMLKVHGKEKEKKKKDNW